MLLKELRTCMSVKVLVVGRMCCLLLWRRHPPLFLLQRRPTKTTHKHTDTHTHTRINVQLQVRKPNIPCNITMSTLSCYGLLHFV